MGDHERDLLDEGVARGIITDTQRAALLALHRGEPESLEERGWHFSGVSVAYGLGALLVIFAASWFLISRWVSLGAWGVLAVAGVYGTALWRGGAMLERRGFPRAGQLLYVLAMAMVPVALWSVMRLTGEWPDPDTRDPLRQYGPYAATRMLVLDLGTLLVALLAWQRRPFPLLTVPMAVSLWWTWFHLGQLIGFDREREWFDQWLMLAAGLALLAAADAVDRWQRGGRESASGDYAAPVWIAATVAFSFAMLVVWLDLDDGKHVLAPVALGLVALSLRTRRRVLLVAGVGGIFGYLAWLASDVFKDGAFFPVALATLGAGLILTTVWLQRRFPALAARVGGATGKDLPWPHWLSWLPALAGAVLAFSALGDANHAEARQREQLLEQRRRNREGPVVPRDTTSVRKP